MPARIDDNPGAFLCHDPLGSAVNGDGRVGHRFRPPCQFKFSRPFVAGSVPGQMSLSLYERVLRVSM